MKRKLTIYVRRKYEQQTSTQFDVFYEGKSWKKAWEAVEDENAEKKDCSVFPMFENEKTKMQGNWYIDLP